MPKFPDPSEPKPRFSFRKTEECPPWSDPSRTTTVIKSKSDIGENLELSTANELSPALEDALFLMLPDVVGSMLWVYGHVSKEEAEKVKWIASLLLVLLTNNWGALASVITSSALKMAGMSPPKAALLGYAVGFFVNSSPDYPREFTAKTWSFSG